MLSLPRVFVLIEGRAVEPSQAVTIFREVSRNPVDDHANAMLMAVIDKVHEVLRRAMPTGGRKVTNRLIAPTPAEGMLADWQQFQVGKAKFLAIVDQLMRQVAVVQPTMFPLAADLPTSQVNLVNGDRLLQPIGLAAAIHPIAVVPLVLGQIGHDRRGAWR